MTRTQPGRLFTCFRIILTSILPRVRRKSGFFLLVESGIRGLVKLEPWVLECGIQLKESRILLTIGIWDPGSTDKESRIQYLESGIHGVESRIQDGLGFLYMWRRIKCYDWKLCFLDSRNCYCRYLDTNVALETHISLLTDTGKQCLSPSVLPRY